MTGALFKVRQQRRGLTQRRTVEPALLRRHLRRSRPPGGRHALSSTGRRRVARPLASRCHACARQAFTNDAVEVKGGPQGEMRAKRDRDDRGGGYRRCREVV